jgi:hypothetical protein
LKESRPFGEEAYDCEIFFEKFFFIASNAILFVYFGGGDSFLGVLYVGGLLC